MKKLGDILFIIGIIGIIAASVYLGNELNKKYICSIAICKNN